MNVGFVSVWGERGAAYVTKAYIEAISTRHDVFLYARGTANHQRRNPNWDQSYVHWGLMLPNTRISRRDFSKWITKVSEV